MKFQPSAIGTADINVGDSAVVGSEVTVRASYDEFISVGSISMAAPASGTLTEEPTYTAPGSGYDMQLVCKSGVRSDDDVVVTLNVTFADNSTGTAAATFGIPAWSKDTSANLPHGLAADIDGLSAGEGKKIKSVTGIASIAGGDTGAEFEIVALPDTASWFDISCALGKEPTLPVSRAMPIRCGRNPSRWTKNIPGEPGKLQLANKFRSFADGLQRLAGHRVSVMLEIKKDGYLLTERQVYGGLRFNPQPKFSGVDDESEVSAESNFETFAVFVAK